MSPEKVLQAFNTWAFKREQPSDPDRLRQVIANAISLGLPVPFVLYWGKGLRSNLDAPDIECLDYLSALMRRVREVYEHGVNVRLIFTDTHAELNGHSALDTRRYFESVGDCARHRGFECCLLGDLVRNASSTSVSYDEIMPEDTLERLSACAAKWYRGFGTPKDGALKYFKMNMVEKRAVEVAFPHSIFITFNGSEYRNLFPDQLPIFYMYSIRRGVSVKPWFLPAIVDQPIIENAPSIAANAERT